MFSKISLLVATSALTWALPSPALHKKYCGTTITPTALYSLNQAYPENVIPTANGFYVAQTYDPVAQILHDQIDQLAYFAGPAEGSYGCQLQVTFPANYNFVVYNGNQLNVYTVATPLPVSGPTYNNIEKNMFLFGTITVVPGQSAVINSHVCPTTAEGGLAYVFSYPESMATSSNAIIWFDSGSIDAPGGITGLSLSYNC